MLTFADLAELTDPGTLGRGRAYARQGRVEVLERRRGELRAEVVGSETYHVRIGEESWWCDCPVGASGALCKHCVAVVVIAEEEYDEDDTAGPEAAPDPAEAWLAGLDADDLRGLLHEAVSEIPGVAELVSRAYIASTDDLTALRSEVEDTLKPRRRFYEYGQANRYASEAEPLLQLLADRAERPSAELLEVVERAVALTVRTILRSDDSSGAQGDQIHRLLDLHAEVATGIAGSLAPKQRRRLAQWLHRFAFSDQQDFFEVDVDRYADALRDDGVAGYRRLVDASAHTAGEHAFSVRYARGRLAILDRDPDRIVSVIGEGLRTQYHVLRVVEALDEAGLPDLAVRYAERGLGLEHSPHAAALVQRLVDDATAHGDSERVLTLRRDAFGRDPSWRTLAEPPRGRRGRGRLAGGGGGRGAAAGRDPAVGMDQRAAGRRTRRGGVDVRRGPPGRGRRAVGDPLRPAGPDLAGRDRPALSAPGHRGPHHDRTRQLRDRRTVARAPAIGVRGCGHARGVRGVHGRHRRGQPPAPDLHRRARPGRPDQARSQRCRRLTATAGPPPRRSQTLVGFTMSLRSMLHHSLRGGRGCPTS